MVFHRGNGTDCCVEDYTCEVISITISWQNQSTGASSTGFSLTRQAIWMGPNHIHLIISILESTSRSGMTSDHCLIDASRSKVPIYIGIHQPKTLNLENNNEPAHENCPFLVTLTGGAFEWSHVLWWVERNAFQAYFVAFIFNRKNLKYFPRRTLSTAIFFAICDSNSHLSEFASEIISD